MSDIHIPDFSKARVLVVGDVMLDKYWRGQTTHISAEAPVPVVKINQYEYRAGGAANVALNIAALGGEAHLLGVVGDDEHAQTLDNLLTEQSVKTHFISLCDQQTTTKLRVVSQNQQLIRLDFEEANHQFEQKTFLKSYQSCIEQCDVIILSDYARGVLSDCQTLIKLAKEANKMVLVDPKRSDLEHYRGASLLTPNMKEFEAIAGHCANEQVMVERAKTLLDTFDLDALLITRGAHGMSLVTENEAPLHIPTRAREIFDVTGAGDTVIGVLAASLAAKESLEESMRLANSAAAVVVAKLGTSVVTVPELRRLQRSLAHVGYGIMSMRELNTALADAKAYGEKIIMTNGCFDILHAGHVNYLNQAKALGDRLIVAVNSDASVKRLKGDERPVNDVKRRMAVLAALDAVDWVVEFDEDTPTKIIEAVRPDVLVKGEDYKIKEIVGAEFVMSYGGKVQTIAFEEDCSTSKIIQSIQNQKGSPS